MWLWARGPPWRTQPHEVNQVWLFGPLFHQEALRMAQGGENHHLSLDSHLSQWRSYSWCTWPMVHITNVNILLRIVLQVERFYMDLIRVEIHCEINLWQAQGNLVGKGECRWANDTRWLAKIPRYHLHELKAQKGYLALAQKLNIFYLVMGLCSS